MEFHRNTTVSSICCAAETSSITTCVYDRTSKPGATSSSIFSPLFLKGNILAIFACLSAVSVGSYGVHAFFRAAKHVALLAHTRHCSFVGAHVDSCSWPPRILLSAPLQQAMCPKTAQAEDCARSFGEHSGFIYSRKQTPIFG